MGIQYNQDGTMEQFGPGQTYGYSNAQAGNGPMQQVGGGGSDFNMSNFLTSKFGSPQSQIRSVGPGTGGGSGGGNIQAILEMLQKQATGDYESRLAQYNNLVGSITGSKGLLNQLGKTGESRIAENQQAARGKTEQDLVSRGLGNSTIRGTMLGGVDRNAEMERQSLHEGIAGKKIGTKMDLFNMSPTPGYDTYLNLLGKLSTSSGGMGGGNSGATSISFGK